MKHHPIEIRAHQELTEADLGELRQLFDSEHLKAFGEWDPQQPCGSADARAMRLGGELMGWAAQSMRVADCGWSEVPELGGVPA